MPPQDPRYFIGLDGGGTSTKAIASDAEGNILGESTSGPSNPNNVGDRSAAENILAALETVGYPLWPSEQVSLCLGIAGLSNGEITTSLQNELFAQSASLSRSALRLTHDLEIAHYAAFRGQPGILIVSGTGSACYAITRDGISHRISGRAENPADPGSGFSIGQQAIGLRLLSKPEDNSRHEIAALAPAVLELASCANPVARGILSTEAHHLTRLASPLLSRFSGSIPLALSGSLLAEANPYQQRLLQSLTLEFPSIRLTPLRHPPHYAALEIARSLT